MGGLGIYVGGACIVILLAILIASVMTPVAEDSYLDDDDWPDHPAHAGA